VNHEVKLNLIWAVVCIVALCCITISAKSCTEVNSAYMKSCIEAGNKPAECQRARPVG
jgi:hypothetical protein